MIAERTGASPTSNVDFWSDEVISNPYPHLRELRDTGSVVWLKRHDVWAVTRHKAVREALLNGAVFTSTGGVSMNEIANAATKGIMLCTDDPEHRQLRRVFARPLMPGALAVLKTRLNALAETRVAELLARGQFDAVSELAHYLPLTVVTDLVGLSEDGKRNMLDWAAGLFNAHGPIGYERTTAGLEITGQAVAYLQNIKREDLDPNGWGAMLFAAADAGELSPDAARAMLMDYLGPALDTTINGLSSALWLFGHNPEQWDLLRSRPELMGASIDEALRMESPIRAFGRHLTQDHELDGTTLRRGDRALMLYACANRDERRYADPDRFDITRDARDHVAFGYGTHLCAGMHMAKLEIGTVLAILMRDVRRFTIVEEVREPHNTLRGLARLVLRVERV